MLGSLLSVSADYTHMSNRKLPVRYQPEPRDQADYRPHDADHARTDLLGLADQLGLSPFSSNVYTRA